MMDSQNLSLGKHVKPVCSSVDLYSLLVCNWHFYREGITHERYRVQTTPLTGDCIHFTMARAGHSHRVELLSRYKRAVTMEERQI